MTWSTSFIPRWDECAQSWECSKASTGAGMRLYITKACEDISKDASEGSAGVQSPPLPTLLHIGPEWREWRMIQFPPWVTPCLGLPDVTDYTCGHLVWSSVCWVWLDSSISFNLSQMDLEPGAESLNSHYRNPHPAYKPFSQGNQLLAKRTPPPDGLWKLRPYKRTGLKECILSNWNWCHRISSATYIHFRSSSRLWWKQKLASINLVHKEPDQLVYLFCCHLKDTHRDFLNTAKTGCFRKFFEKRPEKWVHFLNHVWGGFLPKAREHLFCFYFGSLAAHKLQEVALFRGTRVNRIPAFPPPRLQLRHSLQKHTLSHSDGVSFTKV